MWNDARYGTLIFDTIPHGIFTVDGRGRVSSFNRAAERITGWSRAEALGRACSEVFRSNLCDEACLLRDSILGGEEHRDGEVTILRRDGAELLVSVSTAALRDEGGTVIGGVEMFRDLADVAALRRQLAATVSAESLVGRSAALQGVHDLLPLVARSESTVLIEGEPGTGKELVARAIHNMGPRRGGPFVAVNCGAIPEGLVESELFGHVRGAFTDARRDRAGRFRQAEGGTLLLDEVGELAPALQVKLLRVLQEREYTPLGASVAERADVRILAATNRDLAAEVAAGRFRSDLFFRLNVVRIGLPPLRAREGDVPLLATHFVARFNAVQGRAIRGLTDEALRALAAHDFPGNVRELENAIEHAFVLCCADVIGLSDLPSHIVGGGAPGPSSRPAPARTGALAEAESEAIRTALARAGGSRAAAARGLGISRTTLWRKMCRLGLG